MSLAEPTTPLMTVEEFVKLPDDGKERWLLDGVVYTLEGSETVRNRIHSETPMVIGSLLRNWLVQQPKPRGKVTGGEAGFILSRNPDELVGVDLASVSPEMVAATTRDQVYYDGAPVLAVEILSPSDNLGDIQSKTDACLSAGSVVCVVNPYDRTVSVHQPGHKPRPYGNGHGLRGDPYLPVFDVTVSDLFES